MDKIYQHYIREAILSEAKVLYLVLAPDHHMIFVKSDGVWVMLNSWVGKFGLNFWTFVDHEAEVKYLKLKK